MVSFILRLHNRKVIIEDIPSHDYPNVKLLDLVVQ